MTQEFGHRLSSWNYLVGVVETSFEKYITKLLWCCRSVALFKRDMFIFLSYSSSRSSIVLIDFWKLKVLKVLKRNTSTTQLWKYAFGVIIFEYFGKRSMCYVMSRGFFGARSLGVEHTATCMLSMPPWATLYIVYTYTCIYNYDKFLLCYKSPTSNFILEIL